MHGASDLAGRVAHDYLLVAPRRGGVVQDCHAQALASRASPPAAEYPLAIRLDQWIRGFEYVHVDGIERPAPRSELERPVLPEVDLPVLLVGARRAGQVRRAGRAGPGGRVTGRSRAVSSLDPIGILPAAEGLLESPGRAGDAPLRGHPPSARKTVGGLLPSSAFHGLRSYPHHHGTRAASGRIHRALYPSEDSNRRPRT